MYDWLNVMAEVGVSGSKCAFFLKGKGRSCRMIATRNSRFCPEHLLKAGGEGRYKYCTT